MKNSGWKQGIPEESGEYWFYGDPQKGTKGSDYIVNPPPDSPKLYLVTVKYNKYNTLITVNGKELTAVVFDKVNRVPGVLGYFKKAKLQTIPDDIDEIFVGSK